MNQANSWGNNKFSEAQRQDLWYIDFRQVIDAVSSPTGVVALPKYAKLIAQIRGYDATTFAVRCTLPEEVVEGKMIMTGSQQRYLPGNDSPPGPMRVDFYHEAVTSGQSAAWCMLKAWQLIASAGQASESGRVEYLLLESAASKPSYKVPLTVTFLRGVTADEFLKGESLVESTSYEAQGCWVADLQFNEMSMADNGTPLEFSATIMASKIQPVL